MKTALCLGGGHTLLGDIRKLHDAGHSYDAVFACNDAGSIWRGPLEGWVTLHPEKFGVWMQKRQANGLDDDFGPAKQLWAHRLHKPGPNAPEVRVTDFLFPGQKGSGSSGCFMAKVALIDCKFDRVILCGVPLTQTPHFFDHKDWVSANGFRRQWHGIQKPYLHRMRSMSGWTRVLLGGPDDWRVN